MRLTMVRNEGISNIRLVRTSWLIEDREERRVPMRVSHRLGKVRRGEREREREREREKREREEGGDRDRERERGGGGRQTEREREREREREGGERQR